MVIKLGQLVSKATLKGTKLILVDWKYGQLNTRLLVINPQLNTIEFYVVPTPVAEPVLAKALEEIQRDKYIEIEIMVDSLSQRVTNIKFTGKTYDSDEVKNRLYSVKTPRNYVIIELDSAQLLPLGDRYMISQGTVNLTLFANSLFILSRKYLEGLEKILAENPNSLIKCLIGLTLRPTRAVQLGVTELNESVIQNYAQSLSTFTTVFLFIPVDLVEIPAENPAQGTDGDRAAHVEEQPSESDGELEEIKEMAKKLMSQVIEDAGES